MANISQIYWWSQFINNNLAPHIDPEKPGEPMVEKDADGHVVSYENTGEIVIEEAGTTVDTEFVPFDGKDWELHIYAKFAYADQTEEYPTLFCCMSSTSPWPGVLVRYEDTQLYLIANDGDGNKHYYSISVDNNDEINMTIKYINGNMTTTHNGTTIMNNVAMSNMNLEGLTLTVGADVNSETGVARRFGVCTVHEFYIKKI